MPDAAPTARQACNETPDTHSRPARAGTRRAPAQRTRPDKPAEPHPQRAPRANLSHHANPGRRANFIHCTNLSHSANPSRRTDFIHRATLSHRTDLSRRTDFIHRATLSHRTNLSRRTNSSPPGTPNTPILGYPHRPHHPSVHGVPLRP